MTTRVAQIRNDELNVLWRTANGIAKSRRFKDVATAEDAFARILVGRDLGMTATDAVSNISFIDQAPVIAAEVQAALLRHFVGPDGERYDYDVVTPAVARETECHIEIKRRDGGKKTWKKRGVEMFSFADAERAELTGNDYWRRWPRRMLFARALTTAIATYAPETVHPQLATELPAAEVLDVVDRGEGAELAEDDPLRADALLTDPADDDRSISQASVAHIREIHDYLEHRSELQRLVETLDVVGAPAHDELIQRVCSMTEGQAGELIQRLAIPPRHIGAFKGDQTRREARERQAARDRRVAEREAAPA